MVAIEEVNREKVNVVVFGSGSGKVLEMLLKESRPSDDYLISAVVTDRACRCCDIAASHSLPLLYSSYLKFIRQCEESLPIDEKRKKYEEQLIEKLEELALIHKFSVDFILLSGYMRIVTSTLLNKYPERVLNIHPADLTILDARGERRYVGANGVYDALIAGERKTRSTMIIVDEGVDSGPIIGLGPSLEYDGTLPVTEAAAKKHQERQKIVSDLPLARNVLQSLSLNQRRR